MLYQTDDNLKNISTTIVDTSNDASFVQVAKQVNKVMNILIDPRQEVKTSVDGGDHNQNISGESTHSDELLTIKYVGNLAQKSKVDVVSDMVSVALNMCIALMEQTAENHLEVYSSPNNVEVDHRTLGMESEGCLPEEGLKCTGESLLSKHATRTDFRN